MQCWKPRLFPGCYHASRKGQEEKWEESFKQQLGALTQRKLKALEELVSSHSNKMDPLKISQQRNSCFHCYIKYLHDFLFFKYYYYFLIWLCRFLMYRQSLVSHLSNRIISLSNNLAFFKSQGKRLFKLIKWEN